jgi:hypothetical protein
MFGRSKLSFLTASRGIIATSQSVSACTLWSATSQKGVLKVDDVALHVHSDDLSRPAHHDLVSDRVAGEHTQEWVVSPVHGRHSRAAAPSSPDVED